MAPAYLTTTEEYEKLVDKFDTFMFDCDGVIWHGDQLVPAAREVLSILRERSTFFIFCFALLPQKLEPTRTNVHKLMMTNFSSYCSRETYHFCHE